jgi:hypothetical protein
MSPAQVLEQFERLEAIVRQQRQQRDEQEAAEREVRSRELEEEQRRYTIWNEGAFAHQRAEERLALQAEHTARCQVIDRAEDVEQRALQAEYNRKRTECHAKHNERRAENGRRIEAEMAELLARQRAQFDPTQELVAGWEAARQRRIADIIRDSERDNQNRQRMNDLLREWEEFHPKPTGQGLGR